MALDSIIGPFTLLDKNSKGARDGKEMKEKKKMLFKNKKKKKIIYSYNSKKLGKPNE